MRLNKRSRLTLAIALPIAVAALMLIGRELIGAHNDVILGAGLGLLAVLALSTLYLWLGVRDNLLPIPVAVARETSSLPPLPKPIGAAKAPHGSEGSCCGHCQG